MTEKRPLCLHTDYRIQFFPHSFRDISKSDSFERFFLDGKENGKCGAFSRLRYYFDITAFMRNNLSGKIQPDSYAILLPYLFRTIKSGKNLRLFRFRNADAAVCYINADKQFINLHGDVNSSMNGIFDRIINDVSKCFGCPFGIKVCCCICLFQSQI